MNLIEKTKHVLQSANLIVIISMGLLYATTFLFFINFYQNYLLVDFFQNGFLRFLVSVFAAISVQALRFAFGILGAFDYQMQNKRGAMWGIAISGGITIVEFIESGFASAIIAENKFYSLFFFVAPIIIFSFLAEIRLILSFSVDIKKEIEKEEIIQEIKEVKGKKGEQTKQLINKVARQLEKDLQRKPLLREIAEKMNISTTTISKYLEK